MDRTSLSKIKIKKSRISFELLLVLKKTVFMLLVYEAATDLTF